MIQIKFARPPNSPSISSPATLVLAYLNLMVSETRRSHQKQNNDGMKKLNLLTFHSLSLI